MSDPQSKLDIFDRISKEKIIELGNFFDGSISYKDTDLSKLEEILGNDFERDDIVELIPIFYNFAIGKRNPDKIFGIVNTSNLDDDKKKVLKETVQKIHDKTDLDEVSTSISTRFLQTFGYPHTHGFATVTEFRPISDDDGIKKIIPSLVVSINTHESDIDKIVNFQLNLQDVEKLVEELNSGADSLKIEIQDLRDKFGDKIID